MKDRKKRNLAIGLLCCMLVFMGVGFAILNSTLNIEGTATAVNTWNIVIDSITPIDNDTAATSVSTEIKASRAEASFAVDFTKPGDYLEYEVVVSNEGSIGGYLESVKLEFENPENTDNSLFKITNDAEEGTAINAGESISFKVRVEYDSEADRMPTSSVNFNLYTNVVQKLEQGGEMPDEEDWTFKVDESGTLIAYNYEKGTDVVIPAEVDGTQVRKINSFSFMPESDALYYVTTAGAYVVIKDELNFDKIKTAFESSAFAVGQNNYYTQSEFDKLGYTVYGAYAANVDLSTGAVSQETAALISLDFSNAIHLEEISDGAFMGATTLTSVKFGNITSLKSIGAQAFYGASITGELILPEGLEVLNLNAFQGNKITTLTIPSTVTYIDEGVFEKNPIEKIIFRRTQEDFEANVEYHTPLCDSYDTVEKVYEPIA